MSGISLSKQAEPKFRPSDGTMGSHFLAFPSSASGESGCCPAWRSTPARVPLCKNGGNSKIRHDACSQEHVENVKRIKQKRRRQTCQTAFILTPSDGELSLGRGDEKLRGRPRHTSRASRVCSRPRLSCNSSVQRLDAAPFTQSKERLMKYAGRLTLHTHPHTGKRTPAAFWCLSEKGIFQI